MALLDQVSDYENIYPAFWECARGKRGTYEFQRFLYNYGEKLKAMELELKKTGSFRWGGYREFYVYDPKKRLVMAAPFRDRIIHAAIHRVIEPILDCGLGVRTFACRHGRGNRKAVLRLRKQLMNMGQQRYCIKLDVQKYFQSISHKVLYEKLMRSLPDPSLGHLFQSVLLSHGEYGQRGQGIPIGNLTSQLFANFYLSSMDRLASDLLDLNFYEDKEEVDAFYIRYMDDMVIIARDKSRALDATRQLVDHAQDTLKLNIPPRKRVFLAQDPIPFLGFVLDSKGHRILSRNERRFTKKLKRLNRYGHPLSLKAQVVQSYEAWKNIDQKNKLNKV